MLGQSWTPSLAYHGVWNKFKLKKFCYWTMHGLWLQSPQYKHRELEEFEYDDLTDLKLGEDPVDHTYRLNINADVECAKKLDIVCPSLLTGFS